MGIFHEDIQGERAEKFWWWVGAFLILGVVVVLFTVWATSGNGKPAGHCEMEEGFMGQQTTLCEPAPVRQQEQDYGWE